MRPISSSDVETALASLEDDGADIAQASPEPTFSAEEKSYYRALREAVLYLDTYLAKGPGFARAERPVKGSEEFKRQRDWVVGYARPLRLAGVASVDLMPAADRFMARPGDTKYFPAPPQLIECADKVRADRIVRDMRPAPPALPSPGMDRAEWFALSNARREKAGMAPLPDFMRDGDSEEARAWFEREKRLIKRGIK